MIREAYNAGVQEAFEKLSEDNTSDTIKGIGAAAIGAAPGVGVMHHAGTTYDNAPLIKKIYHGKKLLSGYRKARLGGLALAAGGGLAGHSYAQHRRHEGQNEY